MSKCLFCYSELDQGDFHLSCSKKFFGNEIAPIVPYKLDELYKLGKIIIEKRTTIPGVQSKLSVEIDKTIKSEPKIVIVGLWGNYILKPPSPHYNFLPEIEDVTMKLARLFGIKTVDHSLIKFKSGQTAYLTKRIDREKNSKLHMEDFCQLSERLTEDKYKGSMESVVKLIDKYSSNPGLDKLTIFQITLFSFLTGNADMHLKNFSMIYKNDLIMLAPAYDLVSTRLVISEKDDPDESALSINGKRRKLKLSDFLSFAKSSGLEDKQIENSVKLFIKKIDRVINLIDQSFLSDGLKLLYKNLIIERGVRLEIISNG